MASALRASSRNSTATTDVGERRCARPCSGRATRSSKSASTRPSRAPRTSPGTGIPETYEGRRITSLAFNLTGVDVSEDMGPFEVVPGTQWDDARGWKDEMFPPPELWPGFAERGVRKYPQMGDISCRSALTIHRGTAHHSPIARPVLVLGVDAPGAGHAALHDMMVTQDYHDALPQSVRDHLVCRIADKLIPVTQKHDIEGLVTAMD